MPTRPNNLHGQAPKRRGENPAKRGYDQAWQAAARKVYGRPCLECGEPADTANHPTPVARGGAHRDEVPEPYCRRCNSSMGAS